MEIYSLKYATFTQYEVCFNANLPREREGLNREERYYLTNRRKQGDKIETGAFSRKIFCLLMPAYFCTPSDSTLSLILIHASDTELSNKIPYLGNYSGTNI